MCIRDSWCTSCKCVLANEEVVEGVCERCGAPVIRKEKSQWMLKITEYAQRLIDDLDDLDFIERVKTQQKKDVYKRQEYSMLPRANRERSRRDVSKLKLSPRSAEIQRLVGRSLRAAVDLKKLGEHTITIDCDVLQGDGGTRTASVTGGYLALALACRRLLEEGQIAQDPMLGYVARCV